MVRKFLKRLLLGKGLSENDLSKITISKIREGGGFVGKDVDILSSNIDLGEPYLIHIGDNVTITGSRVLTHDASLKRVIGYTKTGSVFIGNNVFIGVGSIILPDTRIGDNVVIGAGTVVAKDIPSNCVVVGNPLRVLCSYEEYLEKIRNNMEKYPVVDLYPKDIMNNDYYIDLLVSKGKGFIL